MGVTIYMEERTDQAWIRQLKQNDEACVADLWQMVFRFAVQAARKQRASDDMAHDAAIVAYNRIRQRGVNQYKYNCPFPGYCRVIVVNELLRLYRKQPPVTAQLSETIEEVVGQSDTIAPIDKEQVQARLQPCLDQLPKKLGQVVDLLYMKEKEPEQVAETLGIRRNYVNQLAFRARKLLKQCLEGHGFATVGDLFSL